MRGSEEENTGTRSAAQNIGVVADAGRNLGFLVYINGRTGWSTVSIVYARE